MAQYFGQLFLEKIGWGQSWIMDLSQYFHLSLAQILSNFSQKQLPANRLWRQKKRRTRDQIFSFYSETDYFIYRQKWFNRHKAFWDIALPLFFKPRGRFCEYGSGIGPVTAWLIKYFPSWQYTLTDLDCPALQFARWRFRSNPNVNFKIVKTKSLPLTQNYDVITCKQVLEHVPNASELIKHLVNHLHPGGWLYLDYVCDPGQENLTQSARQRKQVLTYLSTYLRPVLTINPASRTEGYGLYLKPKL